MNAVSSAALWHGPWIDPPSFAGSAARASAVGYAHLLAVLFAPSWADEFASLNHAHAAFEIAGLHSRLAELGKDPR